MSEDTESTLSPCQSTDLAGWGRYPVEHCDVYRPERIGELAELVGHAPQSSLIPRGLGRSYGDAALNGGGGVLQSDRLDRMLAFDSATGILVCEAAVSLADILETFLPRGFFFPVTPGTKFVTVGGAIASDVHGKNHHRSGSMATSVLGFRLLTARGEILECSRQENVDAFWATLGGMGLTGFVLDARLRLERVPSAWMRVDFEKAPHLDAVLERCAASDRDYAYGVAWIDCVARGASLGRSVLMRADHAEATELPSRGRESPFQTPNRFEPSVPFVLPNATLNSLSVRVFNSLFYGLHGVGRHVVDCGRYFYPLDAVHHWSRIYGRRGMIQYQLALPPETSRRGLIEVLEELSSARRSSFLAVLKSFGPSSGGLLSFPRPGFTLALDLPYTGEDLIRTVRRMDEIVLRHGGRIYLAKDSTLGPDHFAEMYPELRQFREIKAELDPDERFASSQSRRLGITQPS
jgi:decaprenylphospho-beta-D-ribofuranose 2-oxidase